MPAELARFGSRFGLLEIAGRDQRTAATNLTPFTARQRLALVIEDRDQGAGGHLAAALQAFGMITVGGGGNHCRGQHRNQHRHLGLTITLADHRPEYFHAALELVRRNRCRRDQDLAQTRAVVVLHSGMLKQGVVGGRRQENMGDAMGLDRFQHRQGVETRQHHGGATHCRENHDDSAGCMGDGRDREMHNVILTAGNIMFETQLDHGHDRRIAHLHALGRPGGAAGWPARERPGGRAEGIRPVRDLDADAGRTERRQHRRAAIGAVETIDALQRRHHRHRLVREIGHTGMEEQPARTCIGHVLTIGARRVAHIDRHPRTPGAHRGEHA